MENTTVPRNIREVASTSKDMLLDEEMEDSIKVSTVLGNLDEISRRGNIFTAFQIIDAPESLSNLMDSYVALLSNLVDTYSAKQAEVIFYKLLGYKEVEISEKLGIYQSSVNTRSTNAQWGLLNMAIKDFEELAF